MPSNAKKERRPYAAPTLETVPIASEQALLAICVNTTTTPGQVFQGAPCAACFSTS